MANWDILKQAISEVIKTNDNQEITGQLLQNVLLNMVTSLGANAVFAGVATPTTNPGTPDGPVFYLASTSGIYANFSGISVQPGEIAVLIWSNASWSKQSMFLAIGGDISSIVRTSVSIQGNSVTIGNEGYCYFSKHSGEEVAVMLDTPQTFTFSGDYVLTFNMVTRTFSSHHKSTTTSDEIILLIYDNVTEFSNYGTLWYSMLLENKIKELESDITASVTSITRAQVSVHGNVVTIGDGAYYFAKHSGEEIGVILDAPQVFEMYNEYVLTFNMVTRTFSSHHKNTTTGDEVILLIYDNVTEFSNYGTLWGDKLAENKIDAVKSLDASSITRADFSISGNTFTLGAGAYYFSRHSGEEIGAIFDTPQTFTFSGDYVLTFNMVTRTFSSHHKSTTTGDEVILLIYDNVQGFNNYGLLWSARLIEARVGAIEERISSLSDLPTFVTTEANKTYQRMLSYLSEPNIDLVGMITDVHTGGTDKYKHCRYLSELNKMFGCSVLVNGGDIGLDVGETAEQASKLIADTKMSMGNSSCWIFCKGNHDSGTQLIGPSVINNALNAPYQRQSYFNFTTGGNANNTGFGSVENTNTGTVYIYLNTDDLPGNGYFISTAQLTWLINTLASIQANKRVVIAMHRCPEHFADWNSYTADVTGDCWDAIRAILPAFVSKSNGANSNLGISWDFRNSPTSAKLVCVLCGDAHFNAFQKINGVNYIVRQGYGGIADSEMPSLATKDAFDYNNQCLLDILAIKTNGDAKVFRIGAGSQSRDLAITY